MSRHYHPISVPCANGCISSSSVVFSDRYLLHCVVMYLPPKECICLSSVSRAIRCICNEEKTWKFYCYELWKNKVHVPHANIVRGFRSAYYRSILLSKYSILSLDDITRFTFNFRFKADAGDHWVSHCPWHGYRDATIVKFRSNKQVNRYVLNEESQKHDSSREMRIPTHSPREISHSYASYSQSNDKTTHKGICATYNHGHVFNEEETSSLIPDPFFPFAISWKLQWSKAVSPAKILKEIQNHLYPLAMLEGLLLSENTKEVFTPFEIDLLGIESEQFGPYSLKKGRSSCQFGGKYGDLVKLHVQNVPVPSYIVIRSPTDNWGYVLQSCWALYTSWRMPLRGSCPQLEDTALKVTVDQQLREVNVYNNSMVNLDDYDE